MKLAIILALTTSAFAGAMPQGSGFSFGRNHNKYTKNYVWSYSDSHPKPVAHKHHGPHNESHNQHWWSGPR